jgi:hypothetical protein
LKGVDRGKVDKSEPKRHTGKWMPWLDDNVIEEETAL